MKAATRAKRASKEIVVATWNTRTMVEKGSNGIGHAEILLRRARRAGCDIVGLQETRRSGNLRFRQLDTRCFKAVERVGKGRTEWGWQYATALLARRDAPRSPSTTG